MAGPFKARGDVSIPIIQSELMLRGEINHNVPQKNLRDLLVRLAGPGNPATSQYGTGKPFQRLLA